MPPPSPTDCPLGVRHRVPAGGQPRAPVAWLCRAWPRACQGPRITQTCFSFIFLYLPWFPTSYGIWGFDYWSALKIATRECAPQPRPLQLLQAAGAGRSDAPPGKGCPARGAMSPPPSRPAGAVSPPPGPWEPCPPHAHQARGSRVPPHQAVARPARRPAWFAGDAAGLVSASQAARRPRHCADAASPCRPVAVSRASCCCHCERASHRSLNGWCSPVHVQFF